jgi:5'-3' exonuclease
MSEVLLIIDGDIPVHLACKPRWEKKIQREDGVLVTMLDDEGERKVLEYTPEEDTIYIRQSWANFETELAALLERFYTTKYLMAVKGDDNFRDLLYADYKANRRKPTHKTNPFVPMIRELAIRNGYALPSHGREADDWVRIWAEQCIKHEIPYVVCTIDKDMKCIPGSFFNMKTKELIHITQEEADRHYYEQLLKGDPTDNIPGVINIGDVKATRILAHLNSVEEYQEEVVNRYIMAYGEEWYEQLLLNGKLIHLQRHSGDYFNFDEWPIVEEIR